MPKREELSLDSLYNTIDINKIIGSIDFDENAVEELNLAREIGCVAYRDGKGYALEMAMIGYIEKPKKYTISVYTREYQHETAHFNVIEFTTRNLVAKIAIPDETVKVFEKKDGLIVLEGYVNSHLQKAICEWLLAQNKDNKSRTNLQETQLQWNRQKEQYMHHISGRQGKKQTKNISSGR